MQASARVPRHERHALIAQLCDSLEARAASFDQYTASGLERRLISLDPFIPILRVDQFR
jgi:hypothetical protein